MTSDALADRRRLLGSLVVGCVVLTGCSSANRVTGSVSFDGQPVESGAIVFRPLDGAAAPQGAVITAGRYELDCRPGRHRVEIRGTRARDESRVSPTTPRIAGLSVREDYIPAAYNSASTLEVEVKAGGDVVDFDLKAP